MATKKIAFDLPLKSTTTHYSLARPTVYTNDLLSVDIEFTVVDMQESELNGATAQILLYMADGSFFQNPSSDVTLDGRTFRYRLKENEGNHSGVAQVQLVVDLSGKEFASPLYEFRILSGLETKVATEVMIHDWTTLTREARAFIEQAKENEEERQRVFGRNESGRQSAFEANESDREASEMDRQGNEAERQANEAERQTSEEERRSKEEQRETNESKRIAAEEQREQRFKDMQVVQDLDRGVTLKTTLEIKDGQPRLKLEEV